MMTNCEECTVNGMAEILGAKRSHLPRNREAYGAQRMIRRHQDETISFHY